MDLHQPPSLRKIRWESRQLIQAEERSKPALLLIKHSDIRGSLRPADNIEFLFHG